MSSTRNTTVSTFEILLNSSYVHHGHASSEASRPLLGVPIPKDVLLSWPPPNHINPETRRPLMFGCELALLSLAGLAVLLRMYSRVWVMRPLWGLGWDDWGVCIGLVFATGLTTAQLVSTNYGYGMHIYDVRPEWIMTMRKLAFATQLTFVACTTTTKLSILWFYLRLSASQNFRRLVWVGMVFVSSCGFSFLVVIVFQCRPIQAYWNLQIHHPTCINESAANIANAVLNSLSDIYVFILPVRDMLRLQLPMKQRIGLVFIFSLGIVVCVAGCLRVWQLQVVLKRTYDNTWEGPVMYILTAVECNITIVCGCLPALKPLVTSALPGIRRLSSGLRKGSWSIRKSNDTSGSEGTGRKESAVSTINGNLSSSVANGTLGVSDAYGRLEQNKVPRLECGRVLTSANAHICKGITTSASSFISDGSIPLYEDIVRSTSKLQSVPLSTDNDLEKGMTRAERE